MSKKRVIVIIFFLSVIGIITILNMNKEKFTETGSIIVHNNLSEITITELYINEDTENLIVSDILPGSSFTINLSEQRLTSLKAIDLEGGVYLPIVNESSREISISITDRYEFNNTIETGGEYWAGSGTEILQVTNRLVGNDIYKLTIQSYQSTTDVLDNLLQAFILYPGNTIGIRLNTGCYSVAATDNENNLYIIEPVNICENSETTFLEIIEETQHIDLETSGKGSYSLSLVNNLDDWVITEIYHKESSAHEWSLNHIDFQSLEPKQVFTLNLPAGTYDIRVIDETNDSYTNLNLSLNENNLIWQITMDNLDPFIP